MILTNGSEMLRMKLWGNCAGTRSSVDVSPWAVLQIWRGRIRWRRLGGNVPTLYSVVKEAAVAVCVNPDQRLFRPGNPQFVSQIRCPRSLVNCEKRVIRMMPGHAFARGG